MTLCKNCGTREAQPRNDYCEPCEHAWLNETTGQSRQQTADGQSSPCVGAGPTSGSVKAPVSASARELRRGTAFGAPQAPSQPRRAITHDVLTTRAASSWIAAGETIPFCEECFK